MSDVAPTLSTLILDGNDAGKLIVREGVSANTIDGLATADPGTPLYAPWFDPATGIVKASYPATVAITAVDDIDSGETIAVTATVTSVGGVVMSGLAVVLTVNNANVTIATAEATTNGSGVATWSITGANYGDYTLTATITATSQAGTANASVVLYDPMIGASGGLGLWSFDEGSGLIAKNRLVDAATVDNNIWHAPEVSLNHQTAGSGTITGEYATAPDSRANRASRLVLNSGQSKTMSHLQVTSGVAHTFSFEYKSNTGGDQTLRGYADSIQALTATTSWQTYTQTWTPATTTPTVGWYSDGTTADVLIANVKVEQGASATAYKAPQSHLVFQSGKSPTWSTAGIVTAANNLGAYAITNETQSLTTLTAYHAFKQVGAIEANYNTLQHFDLTVSKWFAGPGGTAGYQDARVGNQSRLQALGTKAANGDWHVMAVQSDGSKINLFLDGVLTRTVEASQGTLAMSFVRFFSLYTQGFGAIGTHGYAGWYSAAHTPAQVIENTEFIRETIVSRGETFPAISNVVTFEGDSIFEGVAYASLSPVPERCIADMPSNTFVANTAKSGSSVNSSGTPGSYNVSIYARRAAINYGLLQTAASNHILCIGAGTNDMASGTAAGFLANLKAYGAAAKASGWSVVVGTVLPNTTAGFNAKRATANAEINNAANIGVSWDAVADQGGDATYGQDGHELDAAKYPDGVHPSNTTCAALKSYWSTAINSLIS